MNPQNPLEPRRPKVSPDVVLTFVPLLCAVAIRLWRGGEAAFPSDDTYISLHAAKYLGHADPSYAEASFLTGVSSPIHVFALWLALRVLPELWATEALAWLGALAYLIAAAKVISRSLTSNVERGAAMAIACLAGSTSFHLGTGLETVWAMAAVMWVLHLMGGDERERSATVWVASLMPWLRPEFVLWTAGILVWRWFTSPANRARDLVVSVGCVSSYFLLWLLASHTLGPPTASAKQVFFAYYALPLWLRLMVGAIVLGQFVMHTGPLVVLLLPAAWWTTRGRVGMVVLSVFWVGFTLSGGPGLNHNYFRYAHPFVIPLLVVAVTAWRGWWRKALLLGATAAIAFQVPERWRVYTEAQHVVVDAQGVAATWLREHTPAGTRVLVHDAGILSETTNAALIDLVGLKTPSSMRIHANLTGPSGGVKRGEALHAIACRGNPEYYVAFRGWEMQFNLTYELMRHGWAPVPVVRKEFATGAGDLGFTLYRLKRSPDCPADGALGSR